MSKKRDKYQDLAKKLKKKTWNMKVMVIPIVIGGLGTVTKGLVQELKGDQKKQTRNHIFLTEIHKFNSRLFFFSGYEVDSVHENWDHSIHQHVYQGKELELFCFIFGEVIKKFMGSVFFFGHPVDDFEIRGQVETIQTTVLIRSPRIQRGIQVT